MKLDDMKKFLNVADNDLANDEYNEFVANHPALSPLTENYGRTEWTNTAYPLSKYEVEHPRSFFDELLTNVKGGRGEAGIPVFSWSAGTKAVGAGIKTLGDYLQQKRITPTPDMGFKKLSNELTQNIQDSLTPLDRTNGEGLLELGGLTSEILRTWNEIDRNPMYWKINSALNPISMTNPLIAGKTIEAYTGKNPVQPLQDIYEKPIKFSDNFAISPEEAVKTIPAMAGEMAIENVTDPRQILFDLFGMPLAAKGVSKLAKKLSPIGEKITKKLPKWTNFGDESIELLAEKYYKESAKNLKETPITRAFGEWIDPTLKAGGETFEAGAKAGVKAEVKTGAKAGAGDTVESGVKFNEDIEVPKPENEPLFDFGKKSPDIPEAESKVKAKANFGKVDTPKAKDEAIFTKAKDFEDNMPAYEKIKESNLRSYVSEGISNKDLVKSNIEAIVVNGQDGVAVTKNKSATVVYETIRASYPEEKDIQPIFNALMKDISDEAKENGFKPVLREIKGKKIIFMPKLNRYELSSGKHFHDPDELIKYYRDLKEFVEKNDIKQVSFHPSWNKDTWNKKSLSKIAPSVFGDELGERYIPVYAEHKKFKATTAKQAKARFGKAPKAPEAPKVEAKVEVEVEVKAKEKRPESLIEIDEIVKKQEIPERITGKKVISKAPEAITEPVENLKAPESVIPPKALEKPPTEPPVEPVVKDEIKIEKPIEIPKEEVKALTVEPVVEPAVEPPVKKGGSKKLAGKKVVSKAPEAITEPTDDFKQSKGVTIPKEVETSLVEPPVEPVALRKKGGSKKLTNEEKIIKQKEIHENILKNIEIEKSKKVKFGKTSPKAEPEVTELPKAPKVKSKATKVEAPEVTKVETPKVKKDDITLIEPIKKEQKLKKPKTFGKAKAKAEPETKVEELITARDIETGSPKVSRGQYKSLSYINKSKIKPKGSLLDELNTIRSFKHSDGYEVNFKLGDNIYTNKGKDVSTILYQKGNDIHIETKNGKIVKISPEDIKIVLPHNEEFHAGIGFKNNFTKIQEKATNFFREWLGIGKDKKATEIIQRAITDSSSASESSLHRAQRLSREYSMKELNIPKEDITQYMDNVNDYMKGWKNEEQLRSIIKDPEKATKVINGLNELKEYMRLLANKIKDYDSNDEILKTMENFSNPNLSTRETIPAIAYDAYMKGENELRHLEKYIAEDLMGSEYISNNKAIKEHLENGLKMIESLRSSQEKNQLIQELLNDFRQMSQNNEIAVNVKPFGKKMKKLIGENWGDLNNMYVSLETYMKIRPKSETLKLLKKQSDAINQFFPERNLLQMKSMKKVAKFLNDLYEKGEFIPNSKAMRTMGFLVDPMREYFLTTNEGTHRLAQLKMHEVLLNSNNLVLPPAVLKEGKFVANPNIPRNYELLSGKEYGKLNGYYAEPTVAMQLLETNAEITKRVNFFRSFSRYWKSGVTAFNYKTWLNNVSNSLIAVDINDSLGATGVFTNNTALRRHWGNAFKTLTANDPSSEFFKAKQIALNAGALQGSFIREELGVVKRPNLKNVYESLKDGNAIRAIADGIEVVSQFYADQDNIFKCLVFWKKMEDMGLPLQKAIKLSNEELLDESFTNTAYEAGKYARDIITSYDFMPKIIKKVRDVPFIGSPFISFMYSYLTRSLPRTLGIGETIKAGTPAWMKMMKTSLYLFSLPAIGYGLMNRDKISPENMERGMASYDKASLADMITKFGTLKLASKALNISEQKLYALLAQTTRGKFYIGKDSQGKRQFFDYSKIMPMFEAQYMLDPSTSKFFLFKEPLGKLAYELKYNKDFTGRSIIPEGASGTEKMKIAFVYMLNSLLPTALTPKNYKNLIQFWNKETDNNGKLKTPLDNFMWKLMTGWVDSQDPETNIGFKEKNKRRDIQNIKEYIKKEYKKFMRKEISKKEYDEKYSDSVEQIKKVRKYYKLRGI